MDVSGVKTCQNLSFEDLLEVFRGFDSGFSSKLTSGCFFLG